LSSIASPPGRNLLLLHGTFSNVEQGFTRLARTLDSTGKDFFGATSAIYGGRVFAFNHFTVSETPAENAASLLKALPSGGVTFDVVTHSRGALVLRTIVEASQKLPASERFNLGTAVLVAGPNEGTPLASPARWVMMTSWVANLIDMFPANPFAFGIEFVAEAIGWIAHQVTGVLPGISAMNPGGAVIGELQAPPHPPPGRLIAVTSNHEPDSLLLARMADVGIDAFFGMANDLVVPAAGAWRLRADDVPEISGDRIACFGPGGNLATQGGTQVHHCNYFDQPQTIDVLVKTFSGLPLGLRPIDPNVDLPYLRKHRQARPAVEGGIADVANAPRENGLHHAPALTSPHSRRAPKDYPLDEMLHLFVLAPPFALEEQTADAAIPISDKEENANDRRQRLRRQEDENRAVIVASFRNARVVEPFYTSGGHAGARWHDIIAMHERIRDYVDGRSDEPLPTGEELVDYGCDLFDTLFPGDVRRLYDSARAETRGRRLDVVMSSTIGWVADKPWEFAFDSNRRMFLCLEDVNFTRHVLTAVPADPLEERALPLRILVVAAQPVGAAPLSEDEEIAVIKRGFRPLMDAGLAEIEVIVAATPGVLHERALAAGYDGVTFDILHFIGHGEYNADERTGYLLFENERGGREPLRADLFRQIVARRGIRLMFLNACETGSGIGGTASGNRRGDFSAGVAPLLMGGGVPAVIANQFKVLDPSAAAFAQHFYWELARGRRIGDAAREARVAVNYSISGEAIDWAVPVVFARNPGDRLVSEWPTAPSAGLTETIRQHRTAGRRSGAQPRMLVAMWDVNHVVPSLERISRRLNDVQTYFGFEVVDMSAPLGTWRLKQRQGIEGMVAYLDADEVEQKLIDAPSRLGVDALLCVTNFWLKGSGTDNLFAHWNGKTLDESTIFIVSTAGLITALSPPATTVERMIGNLVVGFLSGIEPHGGRGRYRKDCPNFANDERDIQLVAGELRFCAACRKRLDNELRTALEAILSAYPG
jgi:hypothetical protein